MITILKNIKLLIQVEQDPKLLIKGVDMDNIASVEDAYLIIKDDIIDDFGAMDNYPNTENFDVITEIDVNGSMVMPSFCDSHTHLVYPGSRELEYVDKIKGLSYEEIAKRGGGILNSAKLLASTSENELYESALQRIYEIIQFGTGAVEIKSGYGLNLEGELKMLRVIKKLKETTPITIKSTFLGAHAIPVKFKNNREKFINQIIKEMLPQVVDEKLAEYVDVFCDKGFFTIAETEKILEASTNLGLIPKIHANELDYSGGVQVGVKYNALSVDHCEYIGDKEIEALQNSNTIATILPGAAFFLNMPYSPVRDMIRAGLPIALASDYNPGSSPSGNMKFIMSLGCINYKMTPNETINATTINGAYAMGISKTHGSIAKGKKANLIITNEIPSIEYIPYAYTSNIVSKVMLNGKFID